MIERLRKRARGDQRVWADATRRTGDDGACEHVCSCGANQVDAVNGATPRRAKLLF